MDKRRAKTRKGPHGQFSTTTTGRMRSLRTGKETTSPYRRSVQPVLLLPTTATNSSAISAAPPTSLSTDPLTSLSTREETPRRLSNRQSKSQYRTVTTPSEESVTPQDLAPPTKRPVEHLFNFPCLELRSKALLEIYQSNLKSRQRPDEFNGAIAMAKANDLISLAQTAKTPNTVTRKSAGQSATPSSSPVQFFLLSPKTPAASSSTRGTSRRLSNRKSTSKYRTPTTPAVLVAVTANNTPNTVTRKLHGRRRATPRGSPVSLEDLLSPKTPTALSSTGETLRRLSGRKSTSRYRTNKTPPDTLSTTATTPNTEKRRSHGRRRASPYSVFSSLTPVGCSTPVVLSTTPTTNRKRSKTNRSTNTHHLSASTTDAPDDEGPSTSAYNYSDQNDVDDRMDDDDVMLSTIEEEDEDAWSDVDDVDIPLDVLQKMWDERWVINKKAEIRYEKRNDLPADPDRYAAQMDFGEGRGKENITWRLAPPSDQEAANYELPCQFGDLPTLSLEVAPEFTDKVKKSPRKIWKKIFTDGIAYRIVSRTNAHAEKDYKKRLKEHQKHPTKKPMPKKWKKLDVTEFMGFIGALYYMGIVGLNKRSLKDIFAQTGKEAHLPLLQCFSRDRFLEITKHLRFDGGQKNRDSNANKRQKIQDFIDPILERCGKFITSSNTIVVDESLISFKGRVAFRQYLPMKPDKYGMKYFVACDAATGAVLTAKAYVGKESEKRAVGLNTKIVIELVERYKNTGRCIVTDRYYSSPLLARTLRLIGFDFVGTLQTDRVGLPKEFLKLNLHQLYGDSGPAKKGAKPKRKKKGAADPMEGIFADVIAARNGMKSGFLFYKEMTLAKLEEKPDKIVHMISTKHHRPAVSIVKPKPKIIHFYNSKKFGVDLLDQLVKVFSTKRTSRRWPMRIFYWGLDVAAVQAYILFKLSNPNFKDPNYRRTFMMKLADSLMKELRRRRRNTKSAHVRKVNQLAYALHAFLPAKKRANLSMRQSALKKSFEINQAPKPKVGAKRSLHGKATTAFVPVALEPVAKKSKYEGLVRCPFKPCNKKSKVVCDECSEIACPDHRHKVQIGSVGKILCRDCNIARINADSG